MKKLRQIIFLVAAFLAFALLDPPSFIVGLVVVVILGSVLGIIFSWILHSRNLILGA